MTQQPMIVASVAAFRGPCLLWGKRRDDNRFTLPGGKLNPGESAVHAAIRELREEVGLEAKNLQYLGTKTVTSPHGRVVVVSSFRCDVQGEPDITRDPDREMATARFIDVSGGVPDYILGRLHSPQDVTLHLLGLMAMYAPGEDPEDEVDEVKMPDARVWEDAYRGRD